MTHVVCEPCVGCRYTDCVEECPVSCFHRLDDRLVIDPDVCIDCAACVPACPVEAIYQDFDVPDGWQDYVERNAKQCKDAPVITTREEPLPGGGAS